MAYFPIVGRLDCASSSVEHLGFWEMNGYGIMSMFKSDWERFGGENNSVKHHAIFSRLNLSSLKPSCCRPRGKEGLYAKQEGKGNENISKQ